MTERLLQYIWQMQYFNRAGLRCIDGRSIELLHPGTWNRDQGPDFLHAHIRLDGTSWFGHIELHMRASDWKAHAHQDDPNYANVILHVVWQDEEAKDAVPALIPLLVLQGRVSRYLLDRVERLRSYQAFIPCAESISRTPALVWLHWKERMLLERLLRKSKEIIESIERKGLHWEEMGWRMLARNFGLRVNAAAFLEMAERTPYPILCRHRDHLFQLEALLLGQAGFLNKGEGWERWKKEYAYLRIKYRLREVEQSLHYLRMRPANFPERRLLQLARLLHEKNAFFSDWIVALDLKDIELTLALHENPLPGGLINSIIINTVAPIVFAYGMMRRRDELQERAIVWLGNLRKEENGVMRQWASFGLPVEHAGDSQALLELYQFYCRQKRCLDCAVGHSVLRPVG